MKFSDPGNFKLHAARPADGICRRLSGPGRPRRAGLTLLECMIVLVVMSIVAVAAGVGLQGVAKVPTQTDDRMVINFKLIDCLEQMRCEPWATMASKAASLSTNVTVGSKVYPRVVTVANDDADGDGNADSDFRKITATIGSESMSVYETLP
jgi:prepilin-type N-terminal cleavage/methylation domain-containing protein